MSDPVTVPAERDTADGVEQMAEWLDRCAVNGELTEPEFAKAAAMLRRLRAAAGVGEPKP